MPAKVQAQDCNHLYPWQSSTLRTFLAPWRVHSGKLIALAYWQDHSLPIYPGSHSRLSRLPTAKAGISFDFIIRFALSIAQIQLILMVFSRLAKSCARNVTCICSVQHILSITHYITVPLFILYLIEVYLHEFSYKLFIYSLNNGLTVKMILNKVFILALK